MSRSIVIGPDQGAVTPRITLQEPQGIRVDVDVKDFQLNNMGFNHDGFETAFVVVPQHGGRWTRQDLTYEGTYATRNGSFDHHTSFVDVRGGFDLEAAKRQGIAFGLDIHGPGGSDKTTLWLQEYGKNYPVAA